MFSLKYIENVYICNITLSNVPWLFIIKQRMFQIDVKNYVKLKISSFPTTAVLSDIDALRKKGNTVLRTSILVM